MIQSTLIYRDDGLPLCASVDDDTTGSLTEQKKKVKMVVSRMTPQSATEATLESGAYEIHYIKPSTVIYIVICEKGYPRNLAFSYLQDVAQEFQHSYESESNKPMLDRTHLSVLIISCKRLRNLTVTRKCRIIWIN